MSNRMYVYYETSCHTETFEGTLRQLYYAARFTLRFSRRYDKNFPEIIVYDERLRQAINELYTEFGKE